jgi:hypothetical protein
MANFGGKSKKRRVEAGTYTSGEEASRSAPKMKTPRPKSGRKFLLKKNTTTAVNCQGKPVQKTEST